MSHTQPPVASPLSRRRWLAWSGGMALGGAGLITDCP